MAKLSAGQGRLARLFQLLLLLGSGRCPNARGLSEACEVSRRTIYRDLELLELAGVPVQFRSERQGYDLSPGFTFAPPALDEAEALALVVLVRRCGEGDDLGLARDGRSGLRKLIQTLPAEVREKARNLAEPVGPGNDPPPPAPGRIEVFQALLQSLARRVQVRIWTRGESSQALDATKFSPYQLAFVPPGWRLTGRSSAHRGVRTLRISQVRRALLTDEPFAIPPRFTSEFSHRNDPSGDGFNVLARVGPRSLADVLDAAGGRVRLIEMAEDGGALLRWNASGLATGLTWLPDLTCDFEILEPAEFRQTLADLAARLLRAHDDGPPRRQSRDRRAQSPQAFSETSATDR